MNKIREIENSKKKRGHKVLLLLMVFVIMFGLSSPVFAYNDEIRVYVDYNQVSFDVNPQLIGGRTMVPLRAIFEALGATVLWNDEQQEVTAYNEAYLVKASIGSTTMFVNGSPKEIDIAPMLVDGRTLVPARFVAEAFNCDVQWDGSTRTVYITTSPIDYNAIEKGANNSNNSSWSANYYPGTNVETYTSVTGIPLKSQDYLSDGAPYYRYKYTDSEDVAAYWAMLLDNGWSFLTKNDETTETIFESSFYKGSQFIIVDVALELDEVWISVADFS